MKIRHLLGDENAYYIWDHFLIFRPFIRHCDYFFARLHFLVNYSFFVRHCDYFSHRLKLGIFRPFIRLCDFQDRLYLSLFKPTRFVRIAKFRIEKIVCRNRFLRGLVFPSFLLLLERGVENSKESRTLGPRIPFLIRESLPDSRITLESHWDSGITEMILESLFRQRITKMIQESLNFIKNH